MVFKQLTSSSSSSRTTRLFEPAAGFTLTSCSSEEISSSSKDCGWKEGKVVYDRIEKNKQTLTFGRCVIKGSGNSSSAKSLSSASSSASSGGSIALCLPLAFSLSGWFNKTGDSTVGETGSRSRALSTSLDAVCKNKVNFREILELETYLNIPKYLRLRIASVQWNRRKRRIGLQ